MTKPKTKKKAATVIKPNRSLQKLFKLMTPVQGRALAVTAGTSVPHLRHVAAGRRNMGAELAQKLAAATRKFKKPEMLLLQSDLCHACYICPLRTGR